jgi:hypothetical protein
MSYLKLNNSDLGYSDNGINDNGMLEVEMPSPESRGGGGGVGFSILDQIKRSAGHTPAKKIKKQSNLATSLRSGEVAELSMLDSGYATSLTASTSGSLSTDDYSDGLTSAFALFQTSLSSHKEDDDDDNNDGDKYGNRLPFGNTSSVDEHIQNCRPPERVAGHHVTRTTRLMSSDQLNPHQPNETSTQLRSHQQPSPSGSTDSTCWEEDGGDRVSSLFDNHTDGEDDDTYATTASNRHEGNETEDDGHGDEEEEDDDDESQFTEQGGPLDAVESFLDDLADVDDIHQLRKLLYQAGSCYFSGEMNVDDTVEEYRKSTNHGAPDKSATQYTREEMFDYGNDATTEAFTVPRKNAVSSSIRATKVVPNRTSLPTNNFYYPQLPTPASAASPRGVPQAVSDGTSDMDDELETVDSYSLNQIFQNWSLQADTIMDLVTNSTILSHSTADDDETQATPSNRASGASTSRQDCDQDNDARPNLTPLSFLASMLGCQQGGKYY